jgi:hypothetical protein
MQVCVLTAVLGFRGSWLMLLNVRDEAVFVRGFCGSMLIQ